MPERKITSHLLPISISPAARGRLAPGSDIAIRPESGQSLPNFLPTAPSAGGPKISSENGWFLGGSMAQQAFHVEPLHCQLDTAEYVAWTPWMEATAALAGHYAADIQDDPFAYNETTSVGLLSAGAIAAGYHSLVEYCADKRRRSDRRQSVRGRFDLWLGSKEQDWAIEAKQLIPTRGLHDGRLQSALASAVECARDLPSRAAASRVGLLVVSLYNHPNDASKTLSTFGERCHCAWLLQSNHDEAADTYLFFNRA